jgi:2-succinyl-5-enolpyruvyl-6-hydroxy-3-cyclohexene-1-carboxylate synthase
LLPHIQDCLEICFQHHVRRFVISPGSRSAPLTLALARYAGIHTHIVPDERAAAFTALGMALQSRETVGLVCTSGTAVLNFAPAVAEAFFQEVPLLILTADRPPEWIAQQDGQTLYQREVYGKNVKASFEIPADVSHPDTRWYVQRLMNEAALLTQTAPKGPVHLNIALREPLYPEPDEKISVQPDSVKLIRQFRAEANLGKTDWQAVFEMWDNAEKKIIVAAQHDTNPELLAALQHLQEDWEIPVIADIVSNLHTLPDTIRHQDLLLMQKDENLLQNLQPDLLITFGKSLISKNLKIFLRKYKPAFHLHLQPGGIAADTFRTLTHVLPVEPVYFFKTLFADLDFMQYQGNDESEMNPAYHELWKAEDRKARKKLEQTLLNQPFNEFSAIQQVMEKLPDGDLHLSNSMPVRYANFLSLSPKQNIHIFANRGTSGIDGCTGTALGFARLSENPVTLLTGDMAFFYDRNAFWQPDLPANLRIVLLNNHGGGIFRIIDAGNQPEVDDFFETRNPLTAENTARDFGLQYTFVKTAEELETALPTFWEKSDKPKILEIETDSRLNTAVYKQVKAVEF